MKATGEKRVNKNSTVNIINIRYSSLRQPFPKAGVLYKVPFSMCLLLWPLLARLQLAIISSSLAKQKHLPSAGWTQRCEQFCGSLGTWVSWAVRLKLWFHLGVEDVFCLLLTKCVRCIPLRDTCGGIAHGIPSFSSFQTWKVLNILASQWRRLTESQWAFELAPTNRTPRWVNSDSCFVYYSMIPVVGHYERQNTEKPDKCSASATHFMCFCSVFTMRWSTDR